MKAKLNERLSYLNPVVRDRVINDVLAALLVPTPSMIEAGAHALRTRRTDKPQHVRAEACFATMIGRARVEP